MEQQGTVNNRTFVLLNFRSTILAPTIHQLKDHQITNISKNIETPLKIPIVSSTYLQIHLTINNMFFLTWLNPLKTPKGLC